MRDIADEPLQFRIETETGRVEDWVPWPYDADDEDIMVEVGRAIYRHTSETFDLAAFLSGLADLLDAALSDPERRPAVQLCPPQWMVCDWGVVAYGDDGGTYGVNLRTLQQSPSMSPHVADKPWVDVESWDAARAAALAIFGASDPWATTENPPFQGQLTKAAVRPPEPPDRGGDPVRAEAAVRSEPGLTSRRLTCVTWFW